MDFYREYQFDEGSVRQLLFNMDITLICIHVWWSLLISSLFIVVRRVMEMNKIYRVIWNSHLCQWVVASELCRGKTKSTVKMDSLAEKVGLYGRAVLTGAAIGMFTLGSLAVNAVDITIESMIKPDDFNYGMGSVLVSDGITNMSGSTVFSSSVGSSVYYMSLVKGYRDNLIKGDDPSELFSLANGAKNNIIVIVDSVTGGMTTINTYNSDNIEQTYTNGNWQIAFYKPSAEGTTPFIQSQIANVTGGQFNFDVSGDIGDSSVKDTVYIKVTNGEANWNSVNTVTAAPNNSGIAAGGGTINTQTITSANYAGTFTVKTSDGIQTKHVNNISELKDYNNWLIQQLRDGKLGEGPVAQENYNNAYEAAYSFTNRTYTINRTPETSSPDDPLYILPGTRAAMQADGSGSTATIGATGAITSLAGYGLYATNGGTVVNQGILTTYGNQSTAGMWIESGSSGINNGVRYAGRPSGGSAAEVGTDMVTGLGSTYENTGIVNITGWNYNKLGGGNSHGLFVYAGASATNNGAYNVGTTTQINAGIPIGVVVNGVGSAFTNELRGVMYLGRGQSADITSAPINRGGADVEQPNGGRLISVGAGATVRNEGSLIIGDLVQNGVAIFAGHAGYMNVVNEGTIDINGHYSQSPDVNYGILSLSSDANSVVNNEGIIRVLGINGVGIQTMSGGLASSSGMIYVSGEMSPSGLRNYGIWSQDAGSKVTLSGTINLSGNGGIAAHARSGGSIAIEGNGQIRFSSGKGHIGFLIYGADASLNNNGTGAMNVSTENSTLFRMEDGADFIRDIEAHSILTASGKNSTAVHVSGFTNTSSGIDVSAFNSGKMTLNLSGLGATGILVAGGAQGKIEPGTIINLTGVGAIAGVADGQKYDLSGAMVGDKVAGLLANSALSAGDSAFGSGTILVAGADLNSSLNNVTGYISRNTALLHNSGNINFTGEKTTGIRVETGSVAENSGNISVDGVAIHVEGQDSRVSNVGGNIVALGGEAAIKVGNGASLNLTGNGLGNIEGRGTAHGVLLASGAKGLIVDGAVINVNAAGATGYGIENQAEISGIQLKDTTINVADGIAVRTAASLAQTNSGTINISGSGTGLAFHDAAGGNITGDLDLSDSANLVINLKGTGGTGVLVNAEDDFTVKTGASVNVVQADGGVALVVKNAAKEVIQSGNLISNSLSQPVVDAGKVSAFTNQGKIFASSNTALVMAFQDAVNTIVTNDTGAEIRGAVALNGGDNQLLLRNGSSLDGKVSLGDGNNLIMLEGSAQVKHVEAGSGNNTFIIKEGGALFDLLDGGIGAGRDELIFDGAVHTVASTAAIKNIEAMKLKNQSRVTISEALVLTDNGDDVGTVDIETDSELAINPSLAGDFIFKPTLTGGGMLSAELDSTTSAFSLDGTVGSGFSGILRLGTSSFDLSSLNTLGLTQATLQSDLGNITTVGSGIQNIGGFTFNGGKLVVGTIAPGDKVSDSRIETSGTLDVRRAGVVQVTMPTSVINHVPSVNTHNNLMEQDDEMALVNLVTAAGSVIGTGGQLVLQDENGNVISDAQLFDINQNGVVVAEGTYDYQLLTSSNGVDSDGLYIGYGLKELALLGTGSDALILTPNAGATGLAADLRAKLTGDGDLAIEAGNQTVSLSNGGNDYTGSTTVRSGTLLLANNNALGKTDILSIENAASVNTGEYSQTIGALNAAIGSRLTIADGGLLTISDSQRTLGITDGGLIEADTLFGGGGLALKGSALTVNGANNGYSGNVSLTDSSSLLINDVAGLGRIGLITLNGASDILDINLVSASDLTKSLSGLGQVTLRNNTDLQLSGDSNGFSGQFNVESNAVLRAAKASALGSAEIVNDGVTYLTANTHWEFINPMTGQGGLIKSGQGNLVINHDLQYTGNTTVESGTLIIGDSLSSSGALSASSQVNVLSNAALAGTGTINGPVDNQGILTSLNALAGYDVDASNLSVGSLNNQGVVQLAGYRIGNTLTVNGNYVGDGTLILNTRLNDDASVTDKLVVTGDTAGHTGVVVNNTGGQGQQTTKGIEVIRIGGVSGGTFRLMNRVVAGAYEYFLFKGDASGSESSWYLRSVSQPTSPLPGEEEGGNKPKPEDNTPVYRPEAGSYISNMAIASTLFNLRLADREGRAENSSMWLRQVGAHTQFHDASGQLKTTSNRYVVQGGGEIFATRLAETDRLGVGVMLGYGRASNHTDARSGYSSKGEIDGYSTGLYATWYQDAQTLNGAYLDSWAQYNWLNGKVNGEQLSTERYDIDGFSASVETGYRYPAYQGVSGDVFITPQAQIIWSGLKADDHTEANGIRVRVNGDDNIQTRLGLKVSRDGFSDQDRNRKLFTTYAEVNWLHNSELTSVVMDGTSVQQSGSRNLYEVKLGAEGRLNDRLNLWANVGHQLGDDSYSDTSVVLGVKYRF
ncbi:Outer membrane protein IcsA autotransporter precursor [Pragia fontium]|nr:Outer membrane protein IcsA autotransporter precursor [Pragia fontium]